MCLNLAVKVGKAEEEEEKQAEAAGKCFSSCRVSETAALRKDNSFPTEFCSLTVRHSGSRAMQRNLLYEIIDFL